MTPSPPPGAPEQRRRPRPTTSLWLLAALVAAIGAGATLLAVRAVAQDAAKADATKADGTRPDATKPDTTDSDADGPRRAAIPKNSDEESPEYRESADNNISLPVDI